MCNHGSRTSGVPGKASTYASAKHERKVRGQTSCLQRSSLRFRLTIFLLLKERKRLKLCPLTFPCWSRYTSWLNVSRPLKAPQISLEIIDAPVRFTSRSSEREEKASWVEDETRAKSRNWRETEDWGCHTRECFHVCTYEYGDTWQNQRKGSERCQLYGEMEMGKKSFVTLRKNWIVIQSCRQRRYSFCVCDNSPLQKKELFITMWSKFDRCESFM